MTKNLLKIMSMAFVAMLCGSAVFAQTRSLSNLPTSSFASISNDAMVNPSRDAWDILYDYDLSQIAIGFYGVFYYNEQIYTTRWSPSASGNALGKIYKFNIYGTTLTPNGDLTIPGITGKYNFEGFCSDGTYIYAANETGKIFKIDPATWTVLSTIPVPVSDVAPIAYDKTSGGFWITSMFGTTVTLVTSDGTSTGTTLTGAPSNIMGLAYDDVSEGGPYLWASIGPSATADIALIGRWEISTNTFTLIHDVGADFHAENGHSMGALFPYEADESFNLIAISQGADRIIGYEILSLIDPCPAVTNVTATQFEANKVTVSWSAPETKTLTNYVIYQDGIEKATIDLETTTWTSNALATGTYTFAVAAIYNDGDCKPVKVAAAPVEITTCNSKVTNLEVEYASDCSKATLTWNAPAEERTQLLWDNTDINVEKTGLLSQYWSGNDNWIFAADDFDATGTWIIEKITSKGFKLAPSVLPTKFMIVIYENASGKPGVELFRSDSIHVTDGAEPEIILPTPFQLPAAGKYWITIAGVYDVSVSDNTGIATHRWYVFCGPTKIGCDQYLFDKMGLIDDPGGTWKTAAAVGVSGAYSMYFKIEGTPGELAAPKYNVYRDNVQIAEAIEETTFEDVTCDPTEPHTWSVSVVCLFGGNGEWVNVAPMAADCEGINEFSKTISIYPNPASGTVNINAENFAKVEIYNALGQIMLTQNTATVDISNYHPGIYFFKVFDNNNNSAMRRVSVIK